MTIKKLYTLGKYKISNSIIIQKESTYYRLYCIEPYIQHPNRPVNIYKGTQSNNGADVFYYNYKGISMLLSEKEVESILESKNK